MFNTVDPLFEQIQDLFDNNQSLEIVKLLDDTILAEKKNADLYAWRAWSHHKLLQNQEAKVCLDTAYELNANSSMAFLVRGVISLDSIAINKPYDKAIQDFTLAIQYDSNNAYAYQERGWAYQNTKLYLISLEDLSKAISLRPKSHVALNLRGISYYYLNQQKDALKDYSAAIDLNPNIHQYHFNRGLVYYSEGDYNKALENYRKSTEINPDYGDGYTAIGIVLLNQNKWDEAILEFNKAIQTNPDAALAHGYRGDVYFEKELWQEALNDYEIELKKNGNHRDYFENKRQLILEKMENQQVLMSSEAQDDDQKMFYFLSKDIENILQEIHEKSKSKAKQVGHYTKLSVADIFVSEWPETETEPSSKILTRMNFSNAIYMNDPMEGKIFFEYLNELAKTDQIEQAFLNGEKRNETSVYIGSFIPVSNDDDEENKIRREDELVMWRTYGKDEQEREAKGCCIVVNTDFFGAEKSDRGAYNKISDETLLNVAYIRKAKNGRVISNDENQLSTNIKELTTRLLKLIDLRDKYKPDDSFYLLINKLIFDKLSILSYQFKSADYDYEREARTIAYMARNSDFIKGRSSNSPNAPAKRFYIESNKVLLPYIEKIYLGPRVENPAQWSMYFDYEIRQRSKDPLYLAYKLKPVAILKSECKFQ